MSKRAGKPRKDATRRTIRRWEDPMNRERYDHIKKRWEPSANPDCTRGRNGVRFDKRGGKSQIIDDSTPTQDFIGANDVKIVQDNDIPEGTIVIEGGKK